MNIKLNETLAFIKDKFISLKNRLSLIKVYALVGPPGTGKSFRAHLIADKHRIPLIIDDGVLIKNMKILAGYSAKFENSIAGAVRRAIFENKEHRDKVRGALEKEKFDKILILGTSLKMIKRITEKLNLPAPYKVIYISDVSTQDEIERAKASRQMGEHVVPAASFEITTIKPNIFLETIKVFFRKNFLFGKREKKYLRSVVRPQFDENDSFSISKAAIKQVIEHCVSEYNYLYLVKDIKIKYLKGGYSFKIYLKIPLGYDLLANAEEIKEYMYNNILKYTVINISKIEIIIDSFYKLREDERGE